MITLPLRHIQTVFKSKTISLQR